MALAMIKKVQCNKLPVVDIQLKRLFHTLLHCFHDDACRSPHQQLGEEGQPLAKPTLPESMMATLRWLVARSLYHPYSKSRQVAKMASVSLNRDHRPPWPWL